MVDVKTYYWSKVKNLTWIFVALWFLIAMILPSMSPYYFKGIRIMGLPSLHMFMNAVIVLVLGVIFIFIYAYVMNKFDAELKKQVTEEDLL